MARTLAAAVREVQTAWHPLFIALAGALLGRQVPAEHVPALCHAVSRLTGNDDRPEDRVTGAKSTIQRWQANLPIAGYRRLAEAWPAVAAALDRAMAKGDEKRARDEVAALAPVVEPPRSVAEVTLALEDAIRNAGTGLTLIQAGCGLGKTRAAERVAAERAAKTHVDPNAKGDRAPFNSKTALAVDKHALAEQVVEHLVQLRTPARRHFGPLALLDVDGKPVCKLADVAEPLVAGGQRMRWLLCEGQGNTPCQFADGCAAKDGAEGAKDARVDVGPHALMGQLDKAAGSTGLLVLDEPPSLLETYSFTMQDLDAIELNLRAFDGDYVTALRPALNAVLHWARTCGPDEKPSSVEDLVNRFAGSDPALAAAQRTVFLPSNVDPLVCAQKAPMPPNSPRVPPITPAHLAQARRSPAVAGNIGRASRFLQIVFHGVSARVATRVETYGGRRVLHLTQVNEQFHQALQRNGAVVVLDANADIHAPAFSEIAQPHLLRFDAPDGAPIERTMHWLPHATRTAWLKDGKLRLAPTLVQALKVAVRWANERSLGGTLALVTMYVVELALRLARDPNDTEARAAWTESGQDAATLTLVQERLGPILQEWKGELLFGHYGALRGLDHMAQADCLVTLGDPWINMSQAEHEAVFLELDNWEQRYKALCRAELEQAHGRLRTVHRTREGRALHVGKELPSGSGWVSATWRRNAVGRPRPTRSTHLVSTRNATSRRPRPQT